MKSLKLSEGSFKTLPCLFIRLAIGVIFDKSSGIQVQCCVQRKSTDSSLGDSDDIKCLVVCKITFLTNHITNAVVLAGCCLRVV